MSTRRSGPFAFATATELWRRRVLSELDRRSDRSIPAILQRDELRDAVGADDDERARRHDHRAARTTTLDVPAPFFTTARCLRCRCTKTDRHAEERDHVARA